MQLRLWWYAGTAFDRDYGWGTGIQLPSGFDPTLCWRLRGLGEVPNARLNWSAVNASTKLLYHGIPVACCLCIINTSDNPAYVPE